VNYGAGPRRRAREPRQQRHRLDRPTCDRVRDAYRGTAIPPWERIALSWRRTMRNLPASVQAKFAIDPSFADDALESGYACLGPFEDAARRPFKDEPASPPACAIPDSVRFEQDDLKSAARDMIGRGRTGKSAAHDRDVRH